jgi:hypothetical protein
MSDHPDDIGYGKPPKHRRFAKGRSGNPKGRPKGSKNFTTIFLDVGRQKIKVTDNGVTREITKFEASAMQLLNKAASGDMRALNTLVSWLRMFQEVVDDTGTRLAPQRLSVSDFMTTAQGFRMATSVGGVLTGRGGDFIVIDDPLKPEALSDTGRKAVNEWFDNTLQSRLNHKEEGVIIIVMQRLHQDDLVGHVLERGDWEVLNFPAIAEEDECHVIETIFGAQTFTRKAGEALHPQCESLASLKRTRELVGEYPQPTS